jgi:flagellar motor component MotA
MKLLKHGLCVLGIIGAFIFLIITEEGIRGINPFLNFGSLILIVFGSCLVMISTFTWSEIITSFRCVLSQNISNFPAEQIERAKQVFASLANSAVVFGCIVSVLGMVLMLNSITDIEMVPTRMALVLTSLFYGLFISEVIFVPLKHKLEKESISIVKSTIGDKGRVLLGMLFFFITLTCFFLIMYSLTGEAIGRHKTIEKITKDCPKLEIGMEIQKISAKNGDWYIIYK